MLKISNEAIELMEKQGGSFVKALAAAWYAADAVNIKKLEETFNYFDIYESIVRKRKQ